MRATKLPSGLVLSNFLFSAYLFGTIETIYYIDNETAQEFADKYQFTLSEEPTLSFWNKIGGKLIGGALIIILIYFYTRRSKASDKEDSE